MALAFDWAVNCTYCPVALSWTHCRPDDSDATSFPAYDGPRMVPVLVMFSASYVVHGTVAPPSAKAEFREITRVRMTAGISVSAFMRSSVSIIKTTAYMSANNCVIYVKSKVGCCFCRFRRLAWEKRHDCRRSGDPGKCENQYSNAAVDRKTARRRQL